MPFESGLPVKAMFFSKEWSVGKTVDFIAQKYKLRNENNLSNCQVCSWRVVSPPHYLSKTFLVLVLQVLVTVSLESSIPFTCKAMYVVVTVLQHIQWAGNGPPFAWRKEERK